MLNDVRYPPTNPDHKLTAMRRKLAKRDVPASRVLDRLPTAARADSGDAIYGEPEDRGDSFNTSMSLAIVLIVTLTVTGLSVWMFL